MGFESLTATRQKKKRHSQVAEGGEGVEGAGHDARDLVRVERQRLHRAQAQEHLFVERAQLVSSQHPAKLQSCDLS
jgi:hypothetical protein